MDSRICPYLSFYLLLCLFEFEYLEGIKFDEWNFIVDGCMKSINQYSKNYFE